MAVFQPVPRTIKAVVQWLLNGQTVENIFYAQAAETVTDAMVAEIADIVATWAVGTLLPNLSTELFFTRVVATDLSAEGSFQTINSVGAGTNGGGTAGSQPNNEALAV